MTVRAILEALDKEIASTEAQSQRFRDLKSKILACCKSQDATEEPKVIRLCHEGAPRKKKAA